MYAILIYSNVAPFFGPMNYASVYSWIPTDKGIGTLTIGIESINADKDADSLASELKDKYGIAPDVADLVSIKDTLVISKDDYYAIKSNQLDPSVGADPTPIVLAINADTPTDPKDTGLITSWINSISNFFSNLFS